MDQSEYPQNIVHISCCIVGKTIGTQPLIRAICLMPANVGKVRLLCHVHSSHDEQHCLNTEDDTGIAQRGGLGDQDWIQFLIPAPSSCSVGKAFPISGRERTLEFVMTTASQVQQSGGCRVAFRIQC